MSETSETAGKEPSNPRVLEYYDMLAALELARVTLLERPEWAGEQLDLSDDELKRLHGELDRALGTPLHYSKDDT